MRAFLVLAAGGLTLCAIWPAGSGDPTRPAVPAKSPAAVEAEGARSLAATRFVPNEGQWHEAVRFGVLGDTAGWVHDDGFTLRYERTSPRPSAADVQASPARSRSGAVLRTRFAGRAHDAVAMSPLPGVHHFLVGADEARHRRGVQAYERVRLADVHPGIDVVFGPLRAGGAGPFSYDLELRAGADLSAFVARCEGASGLGLDAAGHLCIALDTPDGLVELRHSAPVAWQHTPAGPRELAVRFVLLGEDRYGFAADAHDTSLPTTVDPGVVWSSLLGGGATDSVNDLVWRPGVGLWVGGWAGSLDFPTSVGAFRTTGGVDGFVARLSEDGTQIMFATYFGGGEGDEVRGLDVGPGNTVTLAGFTHSTDLPITPGAVQPSYAGASLVLDLGDAFVATLTANGAQLLGATYLGGAFDETVEDVVVDAAGNAYVAGWTSSANFPTTPGAWRPTFVGPLTLQTDGFVTSVAADCRSLRYSTFVGGVLPEQLRCIDIDRTNGEVVAAGWSVSADFPTTPSAYRPSNAGLIDIVAFRLRADGSGPVFSTYLGGADTDVAQSVHLAADGSVWLAGFTNSNNYPTTVGAPQRQPGGGDDGVLTRLAANGQSMPFSTLLGGAGDDVVRDVDVDGQDVLAVGETTGSFPVTAGAAQSAYGGGGLDAFVVHYGGGGSNLAYASYVGGSAQDVLARCRIDTGLCLLAGWTFSADFPVTGGALQTQLRGVEDGVVMQLDLLTDLGDGLQIVPLPGSGELRFVGAGRAEVLALRAQNRTGRELVLDGVRVLVAGSGDGPSHLSAVRVYVDDPATPGEFDVLVGGPVAVVQDDSELTIALAGPRVPRLGELVLRVTVDVATAASGATVEAVAATVAADSWQLHAQGQGTGPAVRVFGDGRSDGAVVVAGALPGDVDGDGRRTVRDVRLLCRSFGAASGASDCDGDGRVTIRDVELTVDALLRRVGGVTAPEILVTGRWFTVRGVFPVGAIADATLGGRSLRLGRLTPRELTFFVESAQPVGLQTLQVHVGGFAVVTRDVLVQ